VRWGEGAARWDQPQTWVPHVSLLRHGIHLALVLLTLTASAQLKSWRPATETELHTIIPARAPALSERIETEFRTASGISDGKGHFIAGVVMITAGYAAEGKYSHYFLTQVPIKIGSFALAPGNYLFGWTRAPGGDTLKVTFYQAATGAPVGEVDAPRDPSTTRVESFHIWPPDKSIIQIGRFTFPYSVAAP
jgi:hypothetical protein